MCTAVVYKTKNFYFGRNLDYEISYGDEVVITPRNYNINFKNEGNIKKHYAIIGMGCLREGFPLYYDGINEKGLGMAGLNFVGNAEYKEKNKEKHNITQYELILWILGQCGTVKEVKKILKRTNIIGEPFENMPIAKLHWIIADKDEAITLECVKDGMKIYNNTVGVLTNNPSFDIQMFQLNNYMSLSPKPPKNNFSDKIKMWEYSRGMGALGLPGDLSSQSRFIRTVFTKTNSISGTSEMESVSQFFHILGAVEQQKGCCYIADGKYENTIYTSCCNGNKGIYYYTTYNNHQITAVNMHNENLDAKSIVSYPIIQEEQIKMQN